MTAAGFGPGTQAASHRSRLPYTRRCAQGIPNLRLFVSWLLTCEGSLLKLLRALAVDETRNR